MKSGWQYVRQSYLKAILFWSPLFTLGYCLAYPSQTVLPIRFAALYLSVAMITTFSFVGLVLVRWGGEKLLKSEKGDPARFGWHWYFGVYFASVPFSVYLAVTLLDSILHRFQEYPGTDSLATDMEMFRNTVVLGTVMSALAFIFHSRNEANAAVRQSVVKVKALETDRLQAQIAALTAQMNPHFLFNALNTVASLIPFEPAKAEDTVILISDLYRGILAASRKAVHSLKLELELCQTYLAVEKARFEERLESSIEIEPGLDTGKIEIPVLLIQPLVENAIKHGIANQAAGGKVFVRIRRVGEFLEISVEDNGVGFGMSVKAGAGVGIKNCVTRLSLTFGKESTAEIGPRPEGGTRALIRIPASLFPGAFAPAAEVRRG